jgi:cell division protein FtsL
MRPWARLAIVFVVALLGMVWQRVKARQLDREFNQLRQEADRLRYENGRLQVQIHQWVSPTNLDTHAKQRGLLPLSPAQRVSVSRS